MSALRGPPLRTLGVCGCIFPLSRVSIQSCDSAPRRCSTTATFFSSCWSPCGPAPRRTGRRLPARGCPSPSRHTGTTPCFPCESHTQQCPLPRVLPPPGFWEKDRKGEREEEGGRKEGERDQFSRIREKMQFGERAKPGGTSPRAVISTRTSGQF